MGCKVKIQIISVTFSSPSNSQVMNSLHALSERSYSSKGEVNWKGNVRDSFLLTCDTMSENLQLWKTEWKSLSLRKALLFWSRDQKLMYHVFWQKLQCQRQFVKRPFTEGEHIWCQPLFLLWIILLDNDSTLTAILMVCMAFSLPPSHWAWCTLSHESWLTVWNLLEVQPAGEVIKNWIFWNNI